MIAPQVYYPGILQPKSAVYTKSLGPFPSHAVVRYLPQPGGPLANGNLVFSDGSVTRTLYSAHVDFASLQMTHTEGHLQAVKIADRRIWWKYTVINGLYNERHSDGEIVEGTEKSVPQLAALLLSAMGEGLYDVSALPNYENDRPFVHWECSNPAMELWRLCRSRGCNISLGWDNVVRIVRVGIGSALPGNDVQSVSFGIDVGEYPAKLKLCCDLLFQAKFKLVAYGIDTDGEPRKIEDLSYAPGGDGTYNGWETKDPGDLLPDTADSVARELARQYVFRLFKVVAFADGSLNVPGYGATASIEKCYPIGEKLVETYENALDGQVYQTPAFAEGVFVPGVSSASFDVDGIFPTANTAAGTVCPYGMRIFGETGFVLFDRPVVRFSADTAGEFQPGTMFLTASFRVRHDAQNFYIQYARDLNIPGGTGIYPIPRRDLRRTIIARYQSENPTAVDTGAIIDNLEDVNAAADQILQNALPEFASYDSTYVRYMGYQPIDTDGAIRQVTLSMDGGEGGRGANTGAARNSEPDLGEMRQAEMERLAVQVQDLQQDRIQADQNRQFSERRGRVS